MKLGFRTTASHSIGYGHLRRCLTLAQASGAECVFFLERAAHGLVQGYEAREWTGTHDCDVLVCDDYSLDGEDVRGAMVLDDPMLRGLALAKWIVNPTPDARYDSPAEQLVGPAYALVRPEFACERSVRPVKRVLVTLGGSDPQGRTRAVCEQLSDFAIDVVVGPLFAHVTHLPGRVHKGLTSLAPLMREADLMVCGGGQTIFEGAVSGVPMLALQIADNQARALSRFSFLRVTTEHTLAADARALANDLEQLQRMSGEGRRQVDGQGARRIVEALCR